MGVTPGASRDGRRGSEGHVVAISIKLEGRRKWERLQESAEARSGGCMADATTVK